jgi:hypothetical protein
VRYTHRVRTSAYSIFRRLLLVAALLFGQHSVLLHGLTHATHEAALADHDNGALPALDHDSAKCAAYGALAHAMGGGTLPAVSASTPCSSYAATGLGEDVRAPAAFDSRGPPHFA